MILILDFYRYKGKNIPKYCKGLKGPLGFYESIKEGHITLEKAEEQQKELNSNINKIKVECKK